MRGIERCDYDLLADRYDEVRGHHDEFIMYWTQQLAQAAALEDDDFVLDIGCGTGRYTDALAYPHTRRIAALDLSHRMLKVASSKYEHDNVGWVQGNSEKLPFKQDTFDVALMVLVIHHIPKTLRKQAYSEILSVLRPGGRFVIMTRAHEHIRDSLIALFPGVLEIDLKRMPDINGLLHDLEAVGFSSVSSTDIPNHKLYRDRKNFEKKVQDKYISTLTMFGDEDFNRRLVLFKERLEERFGDAKKIYDPLVFTLVAAEK